MCRDYAIIIVQIQTECHICSTSTAISTGYIQSKHHLSFPCPIRTPPLLPINNENPTLRAHVMSIHLFCPCLVRMPPKGSLPMSSQNFIFPTLVPMCSQYITSSAHVQPVIISPSHVQSVHHLSCKYPVRIPSLLHMPS